MIHRRFAGTFVRATTLERLPEADPRRWDELAISNRDEYAAWSGEVQDLLKGVVQHCGAISEGGQGE